MEQCSLELGDEGGQSSVYADGKKVNFYKLDKTKPYSAEVQYGRAGHIVLFSVSGAVFALLAAIACILRGDLFADVGSIAVFCIIFVFDVIIFIVALIVRHGYGKRNAANIEIFKNCTLTDGIVTEYSAIKRSTGQNQYMYDIKLGYDFTDTDGNARSDVFRSTYGEDPMFYEGQNLMIAFNQSDSTIMRKFTLSEGKKEFSIAESQRLMLDFGNLKREPVQIDREMPVRAEGKYIAYIVAGAFFGGMWVILLAVFAGFIIAGEADAEFIAIPFGLSMFFVPECVCFLYAGIKDCRIFRKIMKNPSFAEGKIFFPKTTYRGKSTEIFYRFIDKSGGRRIEKLAKRNRKDKYKDGEKAIIAYNGEYSAVVSVYTLKRGRY